MYTRWLLEVWGAGDFALANELLAEDLIDHNSVPGQPKGRAGDVWAARSVRTAFLTSCSRSISRSNTTTS
jgi:hypothetical protein